LEDVAKEQQKKLPLATEDSIAWGLATRVVSAAYSGSAGLVAVYILLTCDAGLSGDLYAQDERTKRLLQTSVGFFIWDLWYVFVE
jgi:hypothetical protein